MKNTAIVTAEKQTHVQVDLLQYSSGEANCLFEGENTLYMSLAARPIHYLQAQDGKTHTGLYQRGEMLITPANTPLFVRWEGEENCL
ncbi:MAG: AraC family transcriptional regulator, partial [Cyanobacteria bacterium J06614_10]